MRRDIKVRGRDGAIREEIEGYVLQDGETQKGFRGQIMSTKCGDLGLSNKCLDAFINGRTTLRHGHAEFVPEPDKLGPAAKPKPKPKPKPLGGHSPPIDVSKLRKSRRRSAVG
jgi:hypothetical protein